jgi:predicted metal-binding membrane protein
VTEGNLTPVEESNLPLFSPSLQWTWFLCPWLLIVTAWGLLLLVFSTGSSWLIDHDYLLKEGRLSWIAALGLFLLSWQVMTLAMMLPSTLLTVAQLGLIARGRNPLWVLQLAFIVGYSLIWTLFACIVFVGDTPLHQLINNWWWLYTHSWLIGAGLLLLAGLFQLSVIKRSSLQRCKNQSNHCAGGSSPGIRAHYHRGLRYGLFCLGSCGAIMLVMFGIGMKNLFWMTGLTAIILAEKTLAGERLRYPIAIGFIILALLWLFLSPW